MGYDQPDTVYSGPASPYTKNRPWGSFAEQLVTNTLAIAEQPGADIQANVRPPLTQIQLFPPRFGYGDAVERTLKIEDVVNADDRYNRYDFSGRTSGYQGSSYPSLYGA